MKIVAGKFYPYVIEKKFRIFIKLVVILFLYKNSVAITKQVTTNKSV